MTIHYVGTSGFDYNEWVPAFYPAGLKKKERLRYYASRMTGIEINASFYRKPTLETVQGWAAQAPATFRFSLKGWQRVTHIQRLRDCGELVRAFSEAQRGLGAQAGPTLWQLPPHLKQDPKLLEEFLALLPRDIRAAFEFRHESWLCDATYAVLERAGCALVVADTEESSTPMVRTAPFGYFRLRREDYTEADVARWAEKIAAAGLGETFVYFKHEDAAKGPAYAQLFRRLAGA